MSGQTQQSAAARWQRVKEIFDGAVGLPKGEFTRFLDDACGSDADLRDEVQSLMSAHQGAGEFLEEAAVNLTAPASDAAGRQIGPYHLESLLGQGGMGEVYLSTREVDGYAMPVALKLIRHSALTPSGLRRFRMERQILARLHHPGITRLLDGGITDDGLPYLVTEYIDGTPLDRAESVLQAPLEKKLETFLSICDAVSFAHRHLVVHGDLKPGNILVEETGIKLLDFGISRLLQTGDDTTEDGANGTTQPAMTPAWASPEQLRGEPAGIVSDIYSLGRILYLLLTGETAFASERISPLQLYEKLQHQPIQAPSARIGNRRLEGDLDNIVLKALEFETAERYGSVEALAEDVRAHLTSRPISARAHTMSYRTAKFIRRNRIVVAASAAVLLALISGFCVALWQARIAKLNYERAEHRFQDVRRLASTVLSDVDDAIARLPGSTAVRGTIVRSSLQYLDGLAQEAKDDPTLQEELANAYEKVGDVQGRPGTLNLGATAAALQSYRKAEGIRRALVESAETQAQRDQREEALANTLMRVSSILRATGDTQQALDADRKALELRRALLNRNPASTARLRNVASSLTATSASLSLLGAFQGVLALRQEGLALYEQLAKANPGSDEDLQGLGLAHSRMGSILLHENDGAGAVKHYREALGIQERLYLSHPGQTTYAVSLALAQSNLGNTLRATGDAKSAIATFEAAAKIYEGLVNADPNEVRSRTLLATVRYREARAWLDLGKTDKAGQLLRSVLEERRLLAERNPANAGARGEVAEALAGLGDVELRAKRYKAAKERYLRSLEIFGALKAEGRSVAAYGEEVQRIEARLAEAEKLDR